jgi:site-specific DNA-methyltransferase (adenine-specific)
MIDLKQGDCLELMKDIPNNSVNLILTDPPYNISRKNNFNTMKGCRQGFDFGEWDKKFDQETWLPIAISKLRNGGG